MLKGYKKLKQQFVTVNWNKSWKEENQILNKLIEQRARYNSDSVYDSLFQFRAQTYNLSFFYKLLLWVISFFGFFVLLVKYAFAKRELNVDSYDVAYFYSDTIFSDSLKRDKKLVFIKPNDGKLLPNDIIFLLKTAFKIKFNFSLLSIALFRVAQVRYAVNKYNTKDIWVNMEYSASSGIVKRFCHENGLVISNFMHGEKVLSLRDAFCSFDKMYVWSERYREIFLTLQCKSEICISNPWLERQINLSLFKPNSICYFLKGIESDVEIMILRELFTQLEKLGFSIELKDHPRQNNTSAKLDEYKVIDNKTDLFEIFSKYEFIMAQFSTVLTQAWHLGCKIIVDDLSNKDLVFKLMERKYIFSLERENAVLLSTFIDSN